MTFGLKVWLSNADVAPGLLYKYEIDLATGKVLLVRSSPCLLCAACLRCVGAAHVQMRPIESQAPLHLA